MCIYGSIIKNPKYKANKKNGGVIPAINDKRVMAIPIGCGKCMECRKKKSREWRVRMLEEIKDNKNGVMVTLTFSNESIKKISAGMHNISGYERDNAIASKAVEYFCERWRKKYKKYPRHWLVTELGHQGTENIHLHGIIWTNESAEEISEKWQYGYTWIGDEKQGGWVNGQTVNYIVKYVTKTDVQHKEYNPKIYASKGIGKGYIKRHNSNINAYNGEKTKEYYQAENGYKMAMPMYYRNKLWTEEQREKLWIKKLDEEKRYVDGQEIDTKKGTEEYWKAIKIARKKNSILGFGDNKKNWKRKEYEEQRRNLLFEKRTENTERASTPAGDASRDCSAEIAVINTTAIPMMDSKDDIW